MNVHDFYYKAFEGCKFDSVEDLADAMENMFNEFIDENSPQNLMICDLIIKSDIDFQTLAEHYAADNEDVIRADEDESAGWIDEDEDENEDGEE